MAAKDERDVAELLGEREALRALARRLVLDEHRAEDAVHDAWVVALESPGPAVGPGRRGPLGKWFRGVVKNVARNTARRERERPLRERAAAAPEVPELDLDRDLDLHEEVVAALRGLRQPYRTALYLRYFKDLEPREIAARQGLPVATVKTQLRRGLALLRETLDAKHAKDGGRGAWCMGLLAIAGPESFDPLAVAWHLLKSARPAHVAGGLAATPAVAAPALLALGLGAALAVAQLGLRLEPGAPERGRRAPEQPLAAAPAARPSAEPALAPSERAPAPEAPAAPAAQAGLRGRVLGAAGEPLAGALVRAQWNALDSAVVLEANPGAGLARIEAHSVDLEVSSEACEVRCAADGRFELPARALSAELVEIEHPDFQPARRALGASAVEAGDVGDVRMEPALRLAGRVVDARGLPVAGARVEPAAGAWELALDWGGAAAPGALRAAAALGLHLGHGGTHTDAGGRFELGGLAPGEWSLAVSAPGALPLVREGESPHGLLELGDLALASGAEISGSVLAGPGGALPAGAIDVVCEPLADPERAAAGRVSLAAHASARGEVDASGRFAVSGLTDGLRYGVRFLDRELGFELARAESVAGSGEPLVATLAPALWASARLVDAQTGEPLAHGSVQWSPELGRRVSCELAGDAEGRASARLGAADRALRGALCFASPGYETSAPLSAELQPGAVFDAGTLALRRAPRARVRVTDSSGAPVEGARLRWTALPAEGARTSGRLDAFDELEIESPEAGFAFVRANARRGADGAGLRTDAEGRAECAWPGGDAARLSVLAPGHPMFRADFPASALGAELAVELADGADVEVAVADTAGRPIAGIAVALVEPGGARAERTSDAEGFARFRGTPVGPAAVEVRGEASAALERRAGEWSRTRLALPVRAGVAGVVLEEGQPLAGAALSLRPLGAAPGSAVEAAGLHPAHASSAADGSYRIEGLAPGVYELAIEHPSRALPALRQLELGSGRAQADFDLDVATLAGRVTSPDGAPLAGARVSVAVEGARALRSIVLLPGSPGGAARFSEAGGLAGPGGEARTDADGRWELRGVPSDVELAVRASAEGAADGVRHGVRVAPRAVRSGLDFALEPECTLAVRVRDARGGPAAGSWIALRAPDGTLHTELSDRAGEALFRGLSAGSCAVSVESLAGRLWGEGSGQALPERRDVELLAGWNEVELVLRARE